MMHQHWLLIEISIILVNGFVKKIYQVVRTPIQALIDNLKEDNYTYEYKCDDTGCITHLFFAHNESVALTRQYSSVLLMDCTYKTNKFKMPLLNVVQLALLALILLFILALFL
jgi:hypothetical protein